MERSKEYDAFGPWIYEIDEDHEIPRLFRNYYSESSEPLMLFIIPRNIERRNASPSMDLYDYLVGVYDAHIHIYKRVGKKAVEYVLEYYKILAVKNIHALLKGELIFFTQDGPLIIGYNTVSEDIITKLIKIIEEKISADSRTLDMAGIPVEYSQNGGSLDILFYNLFGKLKETYPGISLAAYQPKLHARRTRELKKKLAEARLQLSSTAFLINEKELIVLERSMSKIRKDKEELDYSYLHIPLRNITGAAYYELDGEQRLYVMEFKVKALIFPYIFDSSNRHVSELCHKLYDFNYLQ